MSCNLLLIKCHTPWSVFSASSLVHSVSHQSQQGTVEHCSIYNCN